MGSFLTPLQPPVVRPSDGAAWYGSPSVPRRQVQPAPLSETPKNTRLETAACISWWKEWEGKRRESKSKRHWEAVKLEKRPIMAGGAETRRLAAVGGRILRLEGFEEPTLKCKKKNPERLK